jgi:16S rRNA (guanine527-N7)-methyltransferase
VEASLGASGLALKGYEVDRLVEYIELLAKWNTRINLTALPLRPPTPVALERLLIEPLMAVEHMGPVPDLWVDVGSGGGSPAIPMEIARPAVPLVMVEVRARKAAFLREAIRVLGLAAVTVENEAFDRFATTQDAGADLMTSRGVRIDRPFAEAARRVLKPGGRLLLFSTRSRIPPMRGFAAPEVKSLGPASNLLALRNVPRET